MAAAIEEAAHYTADLERVSLLATKAVTRLLRRSRNSSPLSEARKPIPRAWQLLAHANPVALGAEIRVAVYAASVTALRGDRAPPEALGPAPASGAGAALGPAPRHPSPGGSRG